ncbi:TlpA family protein disulfide reductase [Terrimonas sp. NA20]|uniref:TlpA family protein disulfide reductase n=1 Tax=Terrimonas ginsenosidimutans TaxID=2908004 RepID=A0ABS9KWV8_9BACT|nr:TlpA disulfide reductase family protein [Terrimonas ginsenosidimutans]MCG2616719.1 TlpA family protein disulfide reductase [Terrimonas ginsenosidimutans]
MSSSYVLIDFWGSWCLPCRKGHPHMIDLYEKYRNKGLEIVGVAADDNTQDAWRKAIVDDKLPWKQVLPGRNTPTDPSVPYGISSYPTKILVDRSGKIIGRFEEDMSALDKLLSDLLK